MTQANRTRFDFSHMNNRSVLGLLTALALTSLGISFFAHFITPDVTWTEWFDGAFQNFSTEMMGAVVTFWLFELILGARQREQDKQETQNREEQQRSFIAELNEQQRKFLEDANKQQEENQRKALQLEKITQLRNTGDTPDKRQSILNEMKALDLLQGAELGDVNLSGVILVESDLSGAELRGANLSGMDLWGANLSGAYLWGANLSGAHLVESDLSGVELGEANLSGTNLREANLSGAYLWGANLSAALLWQADLSGAHLRGAKLEDVEWDDPDFGIATLPDGKKWTAETDMERFTNEEHPQYVATMEEINARRLDQGQELRGMDDENGNPVYPLPGGERLELETMRERVNARRKELGL